VTDFDIFVVEKSEFVNVELNPTWPWYDDWSQEQSLLVLLITTSVL